MREQRFEVGTKVFFSFPEADFIVRAANSVTTNHELTNLDHLRRFVKPQHLPIYFKHDQSLIPVLEPCPRESKEGYLREAGLLEIKDYCTDNKKTAQDEQAPTIHFLICATSVLSYESVMDLIDSQNILLKNGLRPHLRRVPVPQFPPTSEEQARAWSQNSWPTVYKKNHPFSAHHSILSHAEDEIRELASYWMFYANYVANGVSKSVDGEPIGAVVVDRSAKDGPSLIAAARDARWSHHQKCEGNTNGNIMGHAVMRVIGQVARKRRNVLSESPELEPSRFSMDLPFTHAETDAYTRETLAPQGYLCVGLEIYVTHEPCVMCSMAILHSRFGRLVFGQRLPRTGGISAETSGVSNEAASHSQGLGYGLFWRPDLNWKLLAWQWIDEIRLLAELSSSDTHA